MGRNTAAAIALATLAIDRPDDEVMLVLPADAHIDPARDGVFRDVLRTAAEHLATGSFGIDDPLVTLGIQVDRPATEYGYLIPELDPREDVDGLVGLPAAGASRRSPSRRAPRSSSRSRGRRLERRHVPVAAAGDPGRARAVHRAAPDARADGRLADHARARLRVRSNAGLDRLRGHGGRGPATARSSWARWTSAGPTSGRGRRCSRRIGARGDGRRRPGRRDRRGRATTTSSSGGSAAGSGSSRRPSAVA